MMKNERNPSWVPLVALFLPAAQVFLLFRQIRRKAGSPNGLPAFLFLFLLCPVMVPFARLSSGRRPFSPAQQQPQVPGIQSQQGGALPAVKPPCHQRRQRRRSAQHQAGRQIQSRGLGTNQQRPP